MYSLLIMCLEAAVYWHKYVGIISKSDEGSLSKDTIHLFCQNSEANWFVFATRFQKTANSHVIA